MSTRNGAPPPPSPPAAAAAHPCHERTRGRARLRSESRPACASVPSGLPYLAMRDAFSPMPQPTSPHASPRPPIPSHHQPTPHTHPFLPPRAGPDRCQVEEQTSDLRGRSRPATASSFTQGLQQRVRRAEEERRASNATQVMPTAPCSGRARSCRRAEAMAPLAHVALLASVFARRRVNLFARPAGSAFCPRPSELPI